MERVYTISAIGLIILAVSMCIIEAKREPLDLKDSLYCYRFSWLGPRFNNESRFDGANITCTEILGSTTSVPCRQPLAITVDGTTPDMEYVWDNHERDVRCELIQGEVCAKYSHFYDGVVQNITYMCTKAYVDGQGAIEKGCQRQVDSGRVVEVCLCRTLKGAKYPCNTASPLHQIPGLLLLIIIIAGATTPSALSSIHL